MIIHLSIYHSSSSSLSLLSDPEQHKSFNRVHFLFFPLPLWHKEVQKVPAALQEQRDVVEQSPVQLHVIPRASSLQASCTVLKNSFTYWMHLPSVLS